MRVFVTGATGSGSSDSHREVELPISFSALAIEQAGAPVSLKKKSIESLNDDEVLIRVSYASINKMDPGLARRNIFNLPEPYVLGFDFSGEVVKLGGEGKDALRVGHQVFGRTAAGGCFAEHVVAKRENVLLRGAAPAPEASTYGIAYLTAYESLVITANIQQHKGKWIYVAGAAGGVGHFAAQIAKLHGLKVIGTAGKAASLNLLRQIHLKGADLVYDSTYTQSSYTQSAAVVASGGEYIRLGTAAQMSLSGAEDMRAVVESRGAKMIIGDLGRYGVDAHYKAQGSKLIDD